VRFACGIALVALAGVAQERGRLLALRAGGDAGASSIELVGDRPLSFTTLRLSAPPRVVVDFPDADVMPEAGELTVEDGTVRRVAAAAVGQRTARVVIELAAEAEFDVRAVENRVEVRVPRVAPLVAQAPGESRRAPQLETAPEVAPSGRRDAARDRDTLATAETQSGATGRAGAAAERQSATGDRETPGTRSTASRRDGTTARTQSPATEREAETRSAASGRDGAMAERQSAASGQVATTKMQSAASREGAMADAQSPASGREVAPAETQAAASRREDATAEARSAASGREDTMPQPRSPAIGREESGTQSTASRRETVTAESAVNGLEAERRSAGNHRAVIDAATASDRAAATSPQGGAGAAEAPARETEAEKRASLPMVAPGSSKAPRPARAKALDEQKRLAAKEAAERKAKARAAARPPRQVATAARHSITGIGFRPIEGGEVIVRSDHPLEYGVSGEGDTILLHLPSAGIPVANNRRPLDTRFFGGPVQRVVPVTGPAGTDLRIELRGHAEYQLAQSGTVLTVTFSAPR
jgi:hypothetical protein